MKSIHFIFFFISVLLGLTVFGKLSDEQKIKLDSIVNIIEKNESDTSVAKAYLDLTEILYLTNFDTVIVLCEKSIEISQNNLKEEISDKEKLSFKMTLAGAYNNIGYIYDDQGKVVKALDYYHKSLRIREDIKDDNGVAESLNNIGVIYVNQGEWDFALDYYLKSLAIKEPIGDKKSVATSLNNIAAVYRKQGNNPSAILYYKRSLEIREELGDKRGIAISLNNIGTVYNNMNRLDTALSYFKSSITIREEIGDKRGLAHNFRSIGGVYQRMGDFKLAKEYAIRSLKLSNEIGFSERIKDAANLLSQIYQKEGDWKKAFEMKELYFKMKDSLRNKETELASVREQAKYEIEIVEKEKEFMAKEADIQSLKNNKNRMVALFFIIAFILSSILVVVIYRGFRKKILINQLLEKQKDEVSKSNDFKNAMLKEIHHRVKNNLQVVSSLLRLQSHKINDEEILGMFNESQNRILSMARLHEQMYRSEDLVNININNHFTKLINELIKDYQLETKVKSEVEIIDFGLGIKTLVPLGLIINEMISNSLKYAFTNREEGLVTVSIGYLTGNKYELIIGDDGVGMSLQDYQENTTLGSELIQIFTEQLNGSIERLNEEGTMFRIVFENIDNL